MHRSRLAVHAALSLVSLLLASGPALADVTFVAPGIAGGVTNLAIGAEVYDVAFVGNVTHAGWVNQLDFHSEAEAQAAIVALATELNGVGGVTALRYTLNGGSTFDHNSGSLWYAANATSLFGETLIKVGANWQLANPLPGGATAPINGSFPLAFDFTLVSTPTWVDVGAGTAGVNGVPELAGTGTLVGGDPVTIALSDAKANSTSALLIGVTLLNAPFKGGTLVPSADIVVIGIPTDGSGAHQIGFNWPTGIPSGSTFWMQEWIVDPVGPVCFSATNGLRATTP